MQIKKSSTGKRTVQLSKKEWLAIGKKTGWTKKAQMDGDLYPDATDLIEKLYELTLNAPGISYRGRNYKNIDDALRACATDWQGVDDYHLREESD